jgi:D-alanine-D-alanine ligase
MRVCVLNIEDLNEFNPGPFLEKFEWELIVLKRPVFPTLQELAKENRFDVYFNLCDSASDEDSPGLDVVQALERLNLPFTGAESNFYDPTREEMQAVADANGIGFARGCNITPADDLDALTRNLRYPLMVKHPRSYGSIGMTRDSKVNSPEQLPEQFKRISSQFGSARVEEFIEGREYNVFVVDNPDDLSDPFVYPPTELIFPEGDEFWHTDIKWDYSVPFDFKEVVEPGLRNKLQKMCKRFYLAMDGSGCGRCDVRVKQNGEAYLLEINPNPGLLYQPHEYGPADYMILYDPDGYDGFFDRIFRSAFVRQKLRAERGVSV